MPAAPLLSVIMSVFNDEIYLTASVDSILDQSFSDFEFLIVDDGSTDGSRDILQRYADRDQRVTLIANDRNVGLTRSLNRALSQARGCYVARQDSDDISLPSRLELQVAFLEAHPDCGLLGCSFDTIDKTGSLTGHVKVVETDQEIRQEMLFKNPFCHGSIMFRRDLLDISRYDETIAYAQDYALWSRFIDHTRAYNLKSALVHYRVHNNSVSSRKKLEQERFADQISLRNIEKISGKMLERQELYGVRALYQGKIHKINFRLNRMYVYKYLDILYSNSRQSLGRVEFVLREIGSMWQQIILPNGIFKARRCGICMRYTAFCLRWLISL